jgi:hypothetical protein
VDDKIWGRHIKVSPCESFFKDENSNTTEGFLMTAATIKASFGLILAHTKPQDEQDQAVQQQKGWKSYSWGIISHFSILLSHGMHFVISSLFLCQSR